jgi:hypothetical protein
MPPVRIVPVPKVAEIIRLPRRKRPSRPEWERDLPASPPSRLANVLPFRRRRLTPAERDREIREVYEEEVRRGTHCKVFLP